MPDTPYTDGYSRIDWRDPRDLAEMYILPDLGWSCLLDAIVRDAKPGAVLVTYTPAMSLLCEQTLAANGRIDMTVELKPEGMKGWQQ